MLVALEEFRKDFAFNRKEDFLGEGAFGETYKAYSSLREKAVAIKFYKGDLVKYDLGAEIRTAINLEHPNLIRYYYYYQIDYVSHTEQASVMEFADGGDLSSLLKKPLKLELLNLLAQDVLKGLAFLESKKVVHQDIKLENVLLQNKPGRQIAKIADFGLAKTLSADLFSKVKSSYVSMSGTPTYMAPEVIDKSFACSNLYGKSIIKYNTDLWAFGVMLYYLFFKEPPFGRVGPDKTLMQLMGDIVSLEVDKNKIRRLPHPYNVIIESCLVKNANERIASANELLKLFKKSQKRKRIVINRKAGSAKHDKRKKITIQKKRK